jgi:hypothetical protein
VICTKSLATGDNVIRTTLNYFPKVGVIESGSTEIIVSSDVKYILSDNSIDILVNETSDNRKLIYEVIPLGDDCKIITKDNLTRGNGEYIVFDINFIDLNFKFRDYTPEVVISKKLDDNTYELVDLPYELNSSENDVMVISIKPNDDSIYRVDLRFIENSKKIFEEFDYPNDGDYSLRISHKLPRYRVVNGYEKLSGEEFKSILFDVIYLSNYITEVDISHSSAEVRGHGIFKLNIVSDFSVLDVEKIVNQVTTYNAILDFSNTDKEYLMDVAEMIEPNFLLLDSEGSLVCYSTCDEATLSRYISSSIYSKSIQYQVEEIDHSDTAELARAKFIKSLFNILNESYNNSAKVLPTLILNLITNWLTDEITRLDNKDKGYLESQFILESDTAFSRLIKDNYANQVYIESTTKVESIIRRLIQGKSNVIDEFEIYDRTTNDLVYSGYIAWDLFCKEGINPNYVYKLYGAEFDLEDISEIDPLTYSEDGVTYYGSVAFNKICESQDKIEKFINFDSSISDRLLVLEVNDSNRDITSISHWSEYEIDINKLLISYLSGIIQPNYIRFNDLTLETSLDYSHDRLCSYTESEKLIEFYALPKGKVGNEISIKVTKATELTYNIEIFNDYIQESYECYLIKPEYQTEAIPIKDINRYSKLVKVKFYSYRTNGALVDYDDVAVDEYEESSDLTVKTNWITEESFYEYFELPIGEWKLARGNDEDYNMDDLENTITDFSKLGYYPDFVLVPEVPEVANSKWSHYVGLLQDLVRSDVQNTDSTGGSSEIKGLYSQLIINTHNNEYPRYPITNRFVPYKYKESIRNGVDNNNRLIYTYTDIYLIDKLISGCYPYVINLIDSELIRKLSENALVDIFNLKVGNLFYFNESGNIEDLYGTDSIKYEIVDLYDDRVDLKDSDGNITSHVINSELYPIPIEGGYLYNIKSYLDYCKVNYLDYDNLDYYFDKIAESKGQSTNYLIRYLTSKVARELLKAKHKLISSKSTSLDNELHRIIVKCLKLSDYYQSIDYTKVINGNSVQLNVSIKIKELINKEVTTDFSLYIVNN